MENGKSQGDVIKGRSVAVKRRWHIRMTRPHDVGDDEPPRYPVKSDSAHDSSLDALPRTILCHALVHCLHRREQRRLVLSLVSVCVPGKFRGMYTGLDSIHSVKNVVQIWTQADVMCAVELGSQTYF